MTQNNNMDNPKKKKKKRIIDKAKVAENKKKIKAKKKQEAKDNPSLKKKKWIILSAVMAFVLAAGIGFSYWLSGVLRERMSEDAAVEAMVHMEAVKLSKYSDIQHKKDRLRENAGKDTMQALVEAALYMIDGIYKRPKSVELTEENAADFAVIDSCLINTETGKVDVTMSAEGVAVSDDGYYYLFEDNYGEGLTDEEYIVEKQKREKLTFSVNLNYNTVNSRLFKKFVIAVKKDGKFMAVSKPRYITNPEAIAKYNPSFGSSSSKKGLMVDPAKLGNSELDDLGVKHAIYNIPLSRILGYGVHPELPTIYYDYNGKTYIFKGEIAAEFDYVFSTLTNKGITITAVILNDLGPAYGDLYMDLTHPKAREVGNHKAYYFAFNGTDEAGTEYIAAIASFLASRYSGGEHGKVMNWVIGNEINARGEWNYIEYMDVESYAKEYADAFRVFYNAILSVNGNARVYISLDQQWGKNLYQGSYGAKTFMDAFNSYISSEGNIDWNVAHHPYNYPLTTVRAWSSSGSMGSHVLNSENTPVVSVKNIHVLTDYLQRPEYLTDSGEVRHVILSEVGYTSSAGQDLQAASFVYGYKVIEANQYIDSILLSRQTDDHSEVAQGLALGLSTPDGAHKALYNAYKYVDTPQAAQYTDFALDVIGISSWSEVIQKH